MNDVLMNVTLGGFVGMLLALGAALALLTLQKRWKRVRSAVAGLLVSYVTIVLILALTEGYFRFIYVDSGYPHGITLASARWQERYLHYNSDGFRDREWTAQDVAGKTVVLMLGDSFTLGWGIDDPADRFASVLAAHLGSDYAVINLGVGNTDTAIQLRILRDYLEAHPFIQPDVIVWQYLMNDIQFTATNVQGSLDPIYPPMPAIAQESYFANYVFWWYARPRAYLLTGFASDWDYVRAAYDNYVIWDLHQQEINALLGYIETLNVRLVTVIFPTLQDPVGSIAYVDRVAQAVQARGHDDILKLFDAAAAWNPRDMVVSAVDGHPSAAFSRYVGELLYEQFFSASAQSARP